MQDTYDILKETAKKIEYGEWEIKLLFFNGEVIGFDELKPPLKKYRQEKKNK